MEVDPRSDVLRVAQGMIILLKGEWKREQGVHLDAYIEVAGPVPFGSNGGSLIDFQGRVLGINTHKIVQGGTTIPIETIQQFLESLQRI